MERNTTEFDEDVEAVVKAAAWAWYERRGASLSTAAGSLSEPAGSTHTQQKVSIRGRKRSPQPQPSRFMLEAINKTPPAVEDKQQQEQDNNKSSCNFSSVQLLDAYEIERISKHLDTLLLITSSTSSGSSGVKDVEAANRSSSRCWGRGRAKQQIMGMLASSPSSTTTTRTTMTTESAAAAATAKNMVNTRSDDVKNEEKSRGWLGGVMRHNGGICGVNEENRMVKTVLVVQQQPRRRKPENHI